MGVLAVNVVDKLDHGISHRRVPRLLDYIDVSKARIPLYRHQSRSDGSNAILPRNQFRTRTHVERSAGVPPGRDTEPGKEIGSESECVEPELKHMASQWVSVI